MPPISWLQETGFFQPPRPPLSSNRRFKQLLIREGRGMLRLEMNSIETIVQPQERFLREGSSRDIQNNIFELFCRYWNPHQVGETNCMLPTSTQTPDPLEPDDDDADSHLPYHQTNHKNVHELTMPMPSWKHYYKTIHYPSPGGDISFEGISLLWPPFACKATQLSILFY